MSTRGRTLSHKLEAIEYVHAADGLPYRHDFTKDGGTIRLKPDGSVAIRNKHARLWDLFNDGGTEKAFLINPRGTTMAKKKTRRRNRPMTAAQAKYFGPARRRRNAPRRRRSVSAAAPRRRRRRNPSGFSINGIIGKVQKGVVDAALVVTGKALTRFASEQTSYAAGTTMDSAVELAAAIGLGVVGEQFLGADRARFLMAGGLASIMETLLNQANIPQLSPLLGAKPITANTTAIFPSADRMGAFAGGESNQLGAWQTSSALAARRIPMLRQAQSVMGS